MFHAEKTSEIDSKPHTWYHPRVGDQRSPCPALNAMANDGQLPHDGKQITIFKLIRAIREAYHLTWALAIFLGVGGFILLRRLRAIDLGDLALHNAIEHDASLAHGDALNDQTPDLAPTTPDEMVLKRFLDESADGKVMTLSDIARARLHREACYRPRSIDVLHLTIAQGEFALVLEIFGQGKAIPLQYLTTWLKEERIPEGWEKPAKRVGLIRTLVMSWKVGQQKAILCRQQKGLH